MLVKDRKITLAKFIIEAPTTIRIPKRWFKNGWNYWSACFDYIIKPDEIVMVISECEQIDWVTRNKISLYTILPLKPYIEGKIPTNAIYYSEDRINAYPNFIYSRINFDV